MADLWLVEELQDYFISEGLGQLPGDPVDADVPSVWLEREGIPAPRAGERETITIRDPMIGTSGPLEAWVEETFVDIIVRTRRTPAQARTLHRHIRDLLHPIEAHGGRKQWQMNDLLVESSSIWTPEQPLGADDETYWRKAGYRFEVRRKVLAGSSSP